MEKIKLNSCITIAKRISVSQTEQTTDKISSFIPKNSDYFTEFKQKCDKPLTICKDDCLGDFIKSEFNTEGNSCRSPWSNKYFPPLEVPKYPPHELRELEIAFNKIFKEYTKLYYGENAVSSVYVWEQGEIIENGFSCGLMVKNCDNENQSVWDSTNLINVKFYKEKERNQERIKTTYKVASTVLFKIITQPINAEISGSLTKNCEESYYIKNFLDIETHIEKIGKLVETCENNLKNQVDEIYIKKTKEVNFYLIFLLDSK